MASGADAAIHQLLWLFATPTEPILTRKDAPKAPESSNSPRRGLNSVISREEHAQLGADVEVKDEEAYSPAKR